MNRFGRGASKASASTLCQKCLKRGHYSYECKSAAQERPYASRPSRTQQLRNPKLAPKLTNAAPEESLPTKSITDQQLIKSAEERRRKRSLDNMEDLQVSRKRSRSPSRSPSISSRSSDSVSTISTRSSRSPPAHRRSRKPDENHYSRSDESMDRGQPTHGVSEKRRRRASSASSSGARSVQGFARAGAERERNTRIRRGSMSPAERGRRRSRSTASAQRRKRSGSARASDADIRASVRRKEMPEEGRALDTHVPKHRDDHGAMRRDTHAEDKSAPQSPPKSRYSSLSPYSKRIALTRDMER